MNKFFLLFLISLFSTAATAQRAIPELWGMRVHDEAKILSPQTAQQLERELKVFEDSTTNQIAILIIPSLEGDVLEDYALRVAHEAWKLGTKDKDNGILLLIVTGERKMRIEVGQGLEGPLPDAICSRIIRNEIAPAFRRQDFDAGVAAGVHAIMNAIKGEYATDAAAEKTYSPDDLKMKERIVIGLFIFGILSVFTFLALVTQGCAGWGLYAFLIPFYAIFPAVVIGVSAGLVTTLIYMVGLPIAKIIAGKTGWGKRMSDKMGKGSGGIGGSGGGWFIGGGGGGWSSGGGGGFSGGGGGFGGGGSSGSW